MLSGTIFLLALFCCIIFLSVSIRKKNNYKNVINKIPGPPTVPLIGNMMWFTGSPAQIFKNLRLLIGEYGHVARGWIGHLPVVIIRSPDDVETLIASTKHNRKGDLYSHLHGWLGTGLLTSDGEKWQTRRKIITPSFHFNILQDFLTVFVDQTEYLISALKHECGKPHTDVLPFITQFTLHSICETAMGTSLLDNETKYREAIHKMGQYFVYRITQPWFFFTTIYALTAKFWQQRNITKYLHDFSNNVIKERKKRLIQAGLKKEVVPQSQRKKLAMLDILIAAELQGASIDDEGIREEVDTFMFEGHDTTSLSICFTLMLLANNKEVQDKVYEEVVDVLGESKDHKITYTDLSQLKYLERCIKESLRLYPSVPHISRKTNEDVLTKSGYKIPADTVIIIPIYDMHRDPDLYESPLKFDPDRFLPENNNRHPFSYIPFSAGPRNCIGQKFAIIEMKTVISDILRNFSLEPIDTPDTIELIADLVLRPKNQIKVKFVPRLPRNVQQESS